MNMADALQTFFVESRELLEDMETALLGVLAEDDPSDSVNAIFRAAHTIKGSAGLFGLDFIVDFAHVAESVLDKVRDGTAPTDDAMVTLLLACRDHIGSLVEAAAAGQRTADAETTLRAQPLLAQLHLHLGQPHAAPAPDVLNASTILHAPAGTPSPNASAQGARHADHWHISLRFGADVLRNGMDPLSFLRYLGKLGTIDRIVTMADALPALAELDAESCYLGLEIALRSEADRSVIEGAFEFVQDDCVVRILEPHSTLGEYLDLMQVQADGVQGSLKRMGDALVHCQSLMQDELDAALARAAQPAIAELSSEAAAPSLPSPEPMPVHDAAPARQKTGKDSKDARTGETQSVRVDAEKLDRLVDLVGELITASAAAGVAGRGVQSAALHEAHSTLAGLVQEVRDSALQLRMVKIGATFNRFRRVVHDVAREIGKDIALAIHGEDTELDKTVVEKIADPLTHLVRNSIDHGIESAERRAERGKPAQGTVTLNAYHDSGSIVIEVSDDGGGLSREKILAKAVERGLVEAGKPLGDGEIYGLIFEPGFSTAEQVTNLSGRGVGMDVVKRNITALRGVVSVDSQPGVGTTVTVRLPLTLAIINGFQVTVGNAVFVLPLDVIEECVEFTVDTGHDYAELRGQVLPFIRLRKLFKVAGAPSARQSIVVVKQGAQRFGLIVDRLLGEAQTVIKPMAPMFAHLEGISGSSILGSGEVALILDVPMLLRQTQNTKPVERSGTPSFS